MMTSFLTTLSTYVLETINEWVVVPLLLFGFLFLRRSQWGIAGILILFSMIYNPALKSLFKVPLPLALGKPGFAFPSGHMQMAVMFYGWIATTWNDRRSIKAVRIGIGILLALIGFALVYKGYHTPRDIFGAIGFGGIGVWVAYKLCRIPPFSKNPALLGLGASLPASGLILYMKARDVLPTHSIYALAGLISFSILWLVIPKIGQKLSSPKITPGRRSNTQRNRPKRRNSKNR